MLKSASVGMDREEGPLFGNKEASPLFPTLLTEWVNLAVYALLALGLSLCVYQGIVLTVQKEVSVSAPPSVETTPLSVTQAEPLKPFLQYVTHFKKREIFKIYETARPRKIPKLPKIDIRKAAAHLTLSGIIFEDEPQAIIEDRKKNKTYILKKGDYLENLKIDDIRKGKVRLRLDSQTMELEL